MTGEITGCENAAGSDEHMQRECSAEECSECICMAVWPVPVMLHNTYKPLLDRKTNNLFKLTMVFVLLCLAMISCHSGCMVMRKPSG